MAANLKLIRVTTQVIVTKYHIKYVNCYYTGKRMKLTKLLLPSGLLISASVLSSAFTTGDALKLLYNAFFGQQTVYSMLSDPETLWPMDGGYGAPQYPNTYTTYYEDASLWVEQGRYKYEPAIVDFSGNSISWSDYHGATCPDSSAYKEMPITNAYQNTAVLPTNKGKNYIIKSLTLNQNVPFRFTARKHGGLTDLLSDSFYFWNFGDGMRRFNKKGDDYDAEHAYPFLGNYKLSSIVYSEEMNLGIQITVGLNGDFSLADDDIGYGFMDMPDVTYLEGCDVVEVNVIPNNAPYASASAYLSNSGTHVTSYNLTGQYSSDPDGNPLTYSWTYNGSTLTGESVTFLFPTPEDFTEQHTITLTVTDGDKSDSTNKTISVEPYCYSCNGQSQP